MLRITVCPLHYGQQLTTVDNTEPLSHTAIAELQKSISSLLFYGRVVDNTMLTALITLGPAQAKGKEATAEAAQQLLNYCATHPDAVIRFYASDMILHLHSNASYLNET